MEADSRRSREELLERWQRGGGSADLDLSLSFLPPFLFLSMERSCRMDEDTIGPDGRRSLEDGLFSLDDDLLCLLLPLPL
jgi:hypothetical protein